MKLRQLQCFCTLVDCNFNVSRAADVLHASQPAVSKQLKLLEEELGLALFRRQGQRLQGLSRTGEDILHWARTAVGAAANIRQIAHDATARGHGTVVIATTHTHARHVLLQPILQFHARYPGVQLQLLQGTPERVCELVAKGQADMGVASQPQDIPPDVLPVPFLEVPLVLVMPKAHALAREPEISLAGIARHPLIGYNVERPLGALLEHAFREAGVNMKFTVEALEPDVMKRYVSAGLGLAIIPAVAFDAQEDAGLVARDLGHLLRPSISAVLLRRRTHLPRAAVDFVQLLRPQLDRQQLSNLLAAA